MRASIIAIKNQQSADEVAAAKRVYDRALVILVIAGGLAVAIAIAAAVWIIRSIQRPLHSAMEVANQVAEGDLTAKIDVRNQDELGLLLAALQRMQASLVQTVHNVRKGGRRRCVSQSPNCDG